MPRKHEYAFINNYYLWTLGWLGGGNATYEVASAFPFFFVVCCVFGWWPYMDRWCGILQTLSAFLFEFTSLIWSAPLHSRQQWEQWHVVYIFNFAFFLLLLSVCVNYLSIQRMDYDVNKNNMIWNNDFAHVKFKRYCLHQTRFGLAQWLALLTFCYIAISV